MGVKIKDDELVHKRETWSQRDWMIDSTKTEAWLRLIQNI